jgi:hypothetical protein
MVPMPPSATTTASEMAMKASSRPLNRSNSCLMSRYGLGCCSCGNLMFSPIDCPPLATLFDPALAACINPGPPPVTMSNPSAASPLAISKTSR